MFYAHPTALVTVADPADYRPADLVVTFGDFAATTVKVEAVSTEAVNWFADLFGYGAESVELLKSAFQGFADRAESLGLKVD